MDDELRAVLGRLEAGQAKLQEGQAALQEGQATLQDSVARLQDGLIRLQNDHVKLRTAVMDRFDRLENRVTTLEGTLQNGIGSITGILDQLTVREQQGDMLQESIRLGMAAESKQIRSMRMSMVEMQQLLMRLQSEVYQLTIRLDDQEGRSMRQ